MNGPTIRIERLLFDIRTAVAGLARDRLLTGAAVAMLALALSLHATVFAVADAMLFRGFPHVVDNHRLLYMQERDAAGRCCISYADFEDWRAEARSFADLAYVGTYTPIALVAGATRPVDVNAISISSHTFHLLGVAPVMGRDFVAADEAPGAPLVLILTHRFWQTHFGGRADIVGAEVDVNGGPATIIGVMPEGFDFPTRESAWMPVQRGPELRRRGRTAGGFTVVGRLRDGATRAQATVELETINRRLAEAYPATNRGIEPTVASHAEMMSGRDAALIWSALWAAAWCVLLIACANLANLALIRTVGRWREFSTKLALGSGHARLIRQLFFESLAVAAAAGAVAWPLAAWGVRSWAQVSESRYQILDYAFDARTVSYSVAVTLAAAFVIALVPALRVRRAATGHALTPGARNTTADPHGRRLTSVLVAAQMALALVLLTTAGLLVRSLSAIVGADTGVHEPEGIVVGAVRLPSIGYATAEARRRYLERLDRAVASTPGVGRTSLATTIPVRFATPRVFEVDGRGVSPDEEPPVSFLATAPEYFAVVGAQVLAGRAFDARDDATGLPAVIVNARFAERYWPGESAVGRRLRVVTRGEPEPWRVVVGVVSNIMQAEPLRQDFKPLVYVPFAQDPAPVNVWFLARTAAPLDEVVESLRARIQALDPDVPPANLGRLTARFAFDRDAMDAEHSELGKHALVTPFLATIALLFAAAGLAVVMLHAVGQRTREIGVRMAVGAALHDIRRLVLREGLRPVVAGTAVGLAASIAVARLLRSQLVDVAPYDPLTFGAATMLLATIAIGACLWPAHRAASIEPVEALRHE